MICQLVISMWSLCQYIPCIRRQVTSDETERNGVDVREACEETVQIPEAIAHHSGMIYFHKCLREVMKRAINRTKDPQPLSPLSEKLCSPSTKP